MTGKPMNPRLETMDRRITPVNPLERYALIRPELPAPPGEILLRVHENSTRRDATFYVEPGPPENVRVLERPIFITMVLMCRNGQHVWTGDIEWMGLTDGKHFMTVGHPGQTLPNAGDYRLRFTPRMDAVRMMAESEDQRALERHQHDTLHPWRKWLEETGRKQPAILHLSGLGQSFRTRAGARKVLQEFKGTLRENPFVSCSLNMTGASVSPAFTDEIVRGMVKMAEGRARGLSIYAEAGEQLDMARAARDRRRAEGVSVNAASTRRRPEGE